MKKFLLTLFVTGFTITLSATENYRSQAYNLFINGDILQWEELIKEMATQSDNYTIEQNIELLTYYYGLSGHLMGKDKDKAKKMIQEALNILNPLLKTYPENACLLGISANLLGYQIAISPIKATTLAHTMLNRAKQAVKLAPNDPEVNIWGANILFYMPDFLGGDTEQSKSHYLNALQLYENNDTLRYENWMYLQLIVTLGLVEEKHENYQEALKYFRRANEISPVYPYTRNVLIPRVEKKINKNN